MKEREYKWLLTKYEVLCLDEFIERLNITNEKKQFHINYYFDTAERYFHAHDMTVRIRQSGNILKGTVKRHTFNGIHSESSEYDFPAERLPGTICFQGKTLLLQGQMHTQRKVYFLADGMTLYIDKNMYLGKTDYEMELEYEVASDPEAERLQHSVDEWLKNCCGRLKEENVCSKSARFFEAAAGMKDRCIWC